MKEGGVHLYSATLSQCNANIAACLLGHVYTSFAQLEAPNFAHSSL